MYALLYFLTVDKWRKDINEPRLLGLRTGSDTHTVTDEMFPTHSSLFPKHHISEHEELKSSPVWSSASLLSGVNCP